MSPALARQPVSGKPPASARSSRPRDPRLDFFRGLTMFIILIAHVPNNWLALWIPARFGFSDATEVFVFCSGMASALAFGRVFRDRGVAMGTVRVGFRVWQVYWSHVALFMAVAASMAALNMTGWFERDYVGQLNLHRFFDDAGTNLPALMTLTYVPNYFDILPMYLVVLALMPLVVALAQADRRLAAAGVLALWLGANLGGWALPAEPWSEREWFFNPFGWQLVFFTGFAFMAHWLPAPPRRRWLMLLAGAMLLASLPLSYYRFIGAVPEIRAWREAWGPLFQKTDFGILRYAHFLAIAYLAWIAVGERGHRLLPPEPDCACSVRAKARNPATANVGTNMDDFRSDMMRRSFLIISSEGFIPMLRVRFPASPLKRASNPLRTNRPGIEGKPFP